MAAAVCMWSYFGAIHSYFVILMIAFFILMFSEMMLDHIKVHFEDLAMCFVAGLLIPYMVPCWAFSAICASPSSSVRPELKITAI